MTRSAFDAVMLRKDWNLEERVADVLRQECLQIFGSTWNIDNANRLARAAIEEMRRAGAVPNGDR